MKARGVLSPLFQYKKLVPPTAERTNLKFTSSLFPLSRSDGSPCGNNAKRAPCAKAQGARLVPLNGFEPLRVAPRDPKSRASANFTTAAHLILKNENPTY